MPLLCLAQDKGRTDSLVRALEKAKPDTAKVFLLLALADEYENSAPERSDFYIREAEKLALTLNHYTSLLKTYRNRVYSYSYQGKFDSVIRYERQALELARRNKDSFNIGVSYFNMGSTFRYLYELDSALHFIHEGARILNGKGYDKIEISVYDGLGTLYMTLQQPDKAVAYGERSVAIARRIRDSFELPSSLNNLGLIYMDLDRMELAKRSYEEGLLIARAKNIRLLEPILLNNLSDIRIREGNYEEAVSNARQALAIGTEIKDIGSTMNAKALIAYYHVYRKEFTQAEALASEVQQMAEQQSLDDGRIAALKIFTAIAYANGDFAKGMQYENERTKIESTVFNESVRQREAGIRVRFETEKKDNQIRLQQAELSRKQTLIYLALGSALALLVILVLLYRNYRHRQKLQQQRINELETEKKLAATEAVLKGEEQERTRLAKDLHDGLGGMLSGIKYSLNTMKGNLVMTPENAQAFERSIDMLDSSIKEMRRVAHNMMPEALVKFGLDTALRDFCNDVNQSGALEVQYQSIGLEDSPIEQTAAITIYRIVQELLNNIMKHAAARHAIVQVARNNGQISVTVEDDGKGFDAGILRQSKGIGWANIQNRIEFLKGSWDVDSSPGRGTSVHIEILS